MPNPKEQKRILVLCKCIFVNQTRLYRYSSVRSRTVTERVRVLELFVCGATDTEFTSRRLPSLAGAWCGGATTAARRAAAAAASSTGCRPGYNRNRSVLETDAVCFESREREPLGVPESSPCMSMSRFLSFLRLKLFF